MSKLPKQKPGKSVQNVRTPPELIAAVKSRLVITDFDYDLAADKMNTVTRSAYYSEADSALTQTWKLGNGWNWCNPPYSKLGPWIDKAIVETSHGAQTVMLVPASPGSNWWAKAACRAYIVFLNGRVTFVGHTSPYPKDLALLFFTPWGFSGNEIWTWEE